MVQVVRSTSRAQTVAMAAKYAAQGRPVTVVNRQGQKIGGIANGVGSGIFSSGRSDAFGRVQTGYYKGPDGYKPFYAPTGPGNSAAQYGQRVVNPGVGGGRESTGSGAVLTRTTTFAGGPLASVFNRVDPNGFGLPNASNVSSWIDELNRRRFGDADLWGIVQPVVLPDGRRLDVTAAPYEEDEMTAGHWTIGAADFRDGNYLSAARHFGIGMAIRVGPEAAAAGLGVIGYRGARAGARTISRLREPRVFEFRSNAGVNRPAGFRSRRGGGPAISSRDLSGGTRDLLDRYGDPFMFLN